MFFFFFSLLGERERERDEPKTSGILESENLKCGRSVNLGWLFKGSDERGKKGTTAATVITFK